MSGLGDSSKALIAHYLLFCRTEGKSLRTVHWYEQKLEYFTSFLREHQLPREIDQIGPHAIRQFIHHLQTEVKVGENNPCRPTEDRSLSPQTVAGYVRSLRAFFSWAVREGFLDEHPMKHIKTPKTPSLAMPFFTNEEVARLLDATRKSGATGKRNYTMLLILLDTGVRASELTNLQKEDLYLEQGYFKVVGKGSRERIVPLGRSSRRALARYVRKHRPAPALPGIDRVFLTRAGYPLRPGYLYQIISQVCREAGIQGKRLGPHTCRHTFARNFLLNGGDLLTLQRILGHSSLEVVKLYVNLDTRDLLAQQWKYSPVDAIRGRLAS